MATGDSEKNSIFAGIKSGLLGNTSIVKLTNIQTESESLQIMCQAIKKEIFNIRSFELKHKVSESKESFDELNLNYLASESFSEPKSQILVNKTRKNKFFDRKKRIHPILINLANFQQRIQTMRDLDPNMINFALSIDSSFLTYALASEEHKKQFVILLFAAKTVIFHSLFPDQKEIIINLLKQNFSFNPTIVSIAKGYGNLGMLSKADIGITIGKINDNFNWYSQIHMTKFAELTRLVLISGHYSYYRFNKIVFFTIFKEFMMLALFFLFSIQTGFSGIPFVHYDFVIIFELGLSLVPIVIVGSFDKDFSKKNILDSPLMYSQNLNRFEDFSCYLAMIVEGLGHGIIFYVFFLCGVSFIVSPDGYNEDLQIKQMVAFVIINLAFYSKIHSMSSHKTIKILACISSLFCLSIILIIFFNDSQYENFVILKIFANQSFTWLFICMLPVLSYILSLLTSYFYYTEHPRINNRLVKYKNDITKVFCGSIDTNSTEEFSFNMNLKLLKFDSVIKENEYQSIIKTDSKIFKIFLLFLTVFFVISAVFNFFSVSALINFGPFTVIPAITCVLVLLTAFIQNISHIKLNLVIFLLLLAISIIEDLVNPLNTPFFLYPTLIIFFSISTNYI